MEGPLHVSIQPSGIAKDQYAGGRGGPNPEFQDSRVREWYGDDGPHLLPLSRVGTGKVLENGQNSLWIAKFIMDKTVRPHGKNHEGCYRLGQGPVKFREIWSNVQSAPNKPSKGNLR